jgi:uncharacterized repeat protein (TIGR03847 family)
MDPSIDFDELDSFIPGAVGEPGRRVFYLQARRGHQVVSLRLEKEQVGMLGRYLGQLAHALGAPDPERDVAGLIEPVVPEWIVGTISVGVDESSGVIQVTTEELRPEDLEAEDDPVDVDVELRGVARFTLRAAQAAAFAEAAEELVAAGRPPCRLCGRPIGSEGHACPRWN